MSKDEIPAGISDLMRDALAYVEAQVRNDKQGMAAIEGHADPGMLLPVVAMLAEQCAVEGAIAGGTIRFPAVDSDEDRRAAATVVLGHIRHKFEQGGII